MMRELESNERSKNNRPFLGSLESCRGIAALVVAAFHSAQAKWSDGDLFAAAYDRDHPVYGPINFFYTALCNGHAAVVFFFVLSGFVLCESASRVSQIDVAWACKFFARRILRIYPAAIACVCAFVLVYALSGFAIPGTGAECYQPLSILQNILLTRTNINGVMWTVPVEILAIPLIAACIYLIRKNQLWIVAAIATTLTLAAFDNHYRNFFGPHYPQTHLLYCFVFGVFVHALWLRTDWICSACMPNLTAVVAVVLMIAVRPAIGWRSLWSPIFEALLSCVIIAHFTLKTREKKSTFLDRPIWRFTGKISYSFYLLHPLSLIVTWRIVPAIDLARQIGVPSSAVAAFLFIVSTLLIMPLAWLSWRFIEQKSMHIFARPAGSIAEPVSESLSEQAPKPLAA